MKSYRSRIAVGLAVVGMGLISSCSELNKSSAPVALIVTTNQTLQQIDLAGNAAGSTSCDQPLGTVLMEVRLLQNPGDGNLPTDNRFNDVRITSYRVSYVRTDGGKLIPQPFTRSISALLTAGSAGQNLTGFLAFEPGALSQAPFAALLPQNGGRDPETGSSIVKMDIILEVFGETLAGEKVSGSTRIPLNFCNLCPTRGCF